MITMLDPVLDEYVGVSVRALALGVSVFSAAAFGFGRLVREADAQTARPTEIALAMPMPLQQLQMTHPARAEIVAALRSMNNAELGLTYARLHATFRDYIGRDDLSVARALVDYATLAEAELGSRGLRRPSGTESAQAMLTTYELIL
ncbi:hypothetical protein [Pararhodobacter sp. CCB-MM2]|uniref:hypothetical protein n=1 Tax=Pararhodobacter sp. CCB-MM2 TaxID=1786003 RepID=UPI001313F954|nr:hypothetical protein [Pararhodobacter sp. CCB-MM2]MCA2012952.1 hypothetical protein [Cereibacter sphaeroides]